MADRKKSVLWLAAILTTVWATAGFAAAPSQPTTSATTPLRTSEPVVLAGKELPSFLGIAPNRLVAFRYDGRWRQIPVQVDELAEVNYQDIYDRKFTKLAPFKNRVYTDAATCTGPDPDPTLDGDDEVVLLADDAGGRASAATADPAGVAAHSRVEVQLTDPLRSPQASRYVYLFRSEGALDPAAGRCDVRYDFHLLAGDYKSHYAFAGSPDGNPEDSTVATPFYTRHFSDRWISDGLCVLPPAGTGVNLLDRDNVLFMPGLARRSILTFSHGEGAFIVNKSGPVRAIRSYIGCNSGPLSQRTHLFYGSREEILTDLRVHPIPSVMQFFDYSPAAVGMTYANNNNLSPVTIDGVHDEVAAGPLTWEMATGKQGTIIIVQQVESDIPKLASTSYYLDEKNARTPQVVGDAHAYGSSGPWVCTALPNTDPQRPGTCNRFRSIRTIFYQAGPADVSAAQQRDLQVRTPLQVQVSPP